MNKRSFSVIGIGALGSVLTRSLTAHSLPVKSIFSRSLPATHEFTDDLDIAQSGTFPQKKEEIGEVIFLTVQDRYISQTAQKLAAIDDDFSGYTAVHCSGSQTSDSLKVLKEKGAEVASFHPLQTFTKSSKTSDFQNIYIDIEGDKKAVGWLKKLASKMDCTAFEVAPEAKPYLHAAGVMTSNYVVALMESAGQIVALGGLDKNEIRQALMPLVQKSVSNLAESHTLADALSGPVARSDASTIANHLKLLEQDPELTSLYKKLGKVLVQLMKQNDELSEHQIKTMNHILSNNK